MRILVLSNAVPSPDRWTGGSQQSFLRFRVLASEHEFIVAYPDRGNDPPAVTSPQNPFRFITLPAPNVPPPSPPVESRSRFYWQLNAYRRALFEWHPLILHGRPSPAMQAALRKVLESVQADVIHAIGFFMLYELPAGAHNIVAELPDLLSRMYARRGRRQTKYQIQDWIELKKLQRIESRQLARTRAVITPSPLDQAELQRLAVHKPVYLVPNSVDTDYFQPLSVPEQETTLIFSGTMVYWPNVEAMQYFCRDILPLVKQALPGVRLLIVGHNPAPEVLALASESVEVTGYVPDMRPYLARASVAIAPIKDGGGTRIKILEAWAMGKAVISTTVGAEGLEGQHMTHLWIADEPRDFAHAIVTLLTQPELRRRLGENGRRLVKERYSLISAARQINTIYHAASPQGTSTLRNTLRLGRFQI